MTAKPRDEGADHSVKWWGEVLKRAIAALSKHGPVPVVAVALVGLGLCALVAGADPTSVVALVLIGVGGAIYAAERKAAWLRKEKRAEYDTIQQRSAPTVQGRLRRRLDAKARANDPDLFDNVGE